MKSILKISNISAGYNSHIVINDISLSVETGQVISLLGRNGVGKSTLLRAVAGVLPVLNGSKEFLGSDITRWESRKIIRSGLIFVPQDRMCYLDLTVAENIKAALLPLKLSSKEIKDRLSKALLLFGKLTDRKDVPVHNISGGLRQMLVIAMAFSLQPKCLLLDEPTMGLSSSYLVYLKQILLDFVKSGGAIIMAEQKPEFVFDISHSINYISEGKIILSGLPDEIKNNSLFKANYFGINI